MELTSCAVSSVPSVNEGLEDDLGNLGVTDEAHGLPVLDPGSSDQTPKKAVQKCQR